MPSEVLKQLLECGVHFGHQTRRWNPKMKRFIFGERSGIYIIDLEKTEEYLKTAKEAAQAIAAQGGKILFIGTKKQAQDVIETEAKRCDMPYINSRWMGGLLTNFATVRKSIDKLFKIEKMEEEGILENLTKKEAARIRKEKSRLTLDFGGIRNMTGVPAAVFIVDTRREEIAVREAVRLGIPIFGLIDTNCDPDFVNYPIPGNDDALKSIRLIASILAEGILEGAKQFAETEKIRNRKEGKKADSADAEQPSAPVEGAGEAVSTEAEVSE